MSTTSIQWTNKVWNPLRGCSRISPGCLNCYAEKIAARFSDPGQPFHTFAERKPKPHWTGKVELIEDKLMEPLSWRKPCRCFVNSMSDLFNESVPDEWIDRIFAVMALCKDTTFQVLTKRADRMERYMNWLSEGNYGFTRKFQMMYSGRDIGEIRGDQEWPLPNVWLGVSVENQEQADKRIPHLLRTPAAVRFLSCEPLLGPVDLTNISADTGEQWNVLDRQEAADARDEGFCGGSIDWVIAGSESGPGARPAKEEWFRSIKDQCVAAGVPFFLKQYADSRGRKIPTPELDGRQWMEFPL